jgi:DNA-binding Lrp family transcriptional regulator
MSPHVSAPPDPRRSRSLEYGVAILECFTANRPVLRNSEIASMVGISRATTNRYLATLVELGYVEQDSKRRYLLASHAARAGMALVNTVRREIHARAVLEDLRDTTGHTVSMGLPRCARSSAQGATQRHPASTYSHAGRVPNASQRAGSPVIHFHALGGRRGLTVHEELRRCLHLYVPSEVGKPLVQRVGLIEALDDPKLATIGKSPGHRLIPTIGQPIIQSGE